ncbi:very long chain fatty acid elongase 2 isoform 2-T2 [Clarias gariepinus]|uniref:elongation of very long chain fatty acids protein 2 isoform X2 n=1 Tax=Clarias gariepinus TaxID=13013 RepID=UPI00234C80DE|nr:elongation of very long chain fatty acids protein 2 isoform X2 [Clarias gariepinus]
MLRLRVSGRQSDVACELGVSQSVISRLASRHRTTGRVHDRPKSEAPRVTDSNDDQYLKTYALRDRYATATQLQARLQDAKGTRVSRQNIHNRLHRFGLNARRLLQVTPLSPRHRCERLQWAQDHVTWTMQQWSTVLFTDECQQRCWRRRGFFGPTLNSFIHVLMYSYYSLSTIPSMQKYLWWKRYLTQAQLVQFILTITHTLSAVVFPCGFPLGCLLFQSSYMVTLVILFINFYMQAYRRKPAKDGHLNGISSYVNGAKHKLQ